MKKLFCLIISVIICGCANTYKMNGISSRVIKNEDYEYYNELWMILNAPILKLIIFYSLAILSSLFIVRNIYNRIFKASDNEMLRKYKEGKLFDKNGRKIIYRKKFQTRSSITPTWLGILEQLMYITAIISNQYAFIPVWLGLKVAGIWKTWEDSNDRISYNMFVIGNALSLINALVWAIAIKPSILNF